MANFSKRSLFFKNFQICHLTIAFCIQLIVLLLFSKLIPNDVRFFLKEIKFTLPSLYFLFSLILFLLEQRSRNRNRSRSRHYPMAKKWKYENKREKEREKGKRKKEIEGYFCPTKKSTVKRVDHRQWSIWKKTLIVVMTYLEFRKLRTFFWKSIIVEMT